MKTIKGFDGLLSVYKDLPKVGGFYVDEDFLNNKDAIESSNYYLAESEDEEMEDNYKTWLEYPTFKAIILNKLDHHPKSSKDDLLNAIIYYLENDDFLD
ncbi:DUF7716 domain-containing protein [Brenneria tiliae]|uniref:DUF7716 domain-containing protein n=1 Tax=Brenneria tiliae TaxID=2914984 RepID=UPI00201490FC|nr:hypothetical protein [Brenneria tiliae]MCL2896672.1 hypothetical protein [Brenneria tiliae]MCL2901345.1 hypothetical protein [Brenneria tiliae]